MVQDIRLSTVQAPRLSLAQDGACVVTYDHSISWSRRRHRRISIFSEGTTDRMTDKHEGMALKYSKFTYNIVYIALSETKTIICVNMFYLE